MTDMVAHIFAAAPQWRRIVAFARRAIERAMLAYRTRRALCDLSDDILRDVGINRGEIDFVVDAVANGKGDTTRERMCQLNRSAAHVGRTLALVLVAVLALHGTGAAQDAQIKRGAYLVNMGLCNDCHTPGYFFGKPDMARFLGGSEVGFEIPGLGVFHGPNLTPDPETGLGRWSTDEIATAITTGARPDGRDLAPVMPWHAFAKLSGTDVYAIAIYLKSLPAVSNKVPGPFGPNETPTSFVMKVVPPKAPATDGVAR